MASKLLPPQIMILQVPLAFAVCSTGFFFLTKAMLLMVDAILREESTLGR